MIIKSITRWIIPPAISENVNKEFEDYPFLFRQILFNRGITTASEAASFLRADAKTHDPFKLKDLERAIHIIQGAIRNDEKIVIFGDYDVDGVTASALLVKLLKAYGAQVESFIPNRFEEGYGFSMDGIEKALKLKPSLIITVDCGVRSIKEIKYVREMGVEVIITDHHQPHEEIPTANAVICPKQVDDEYPYKELAGVGIAYKLSQGILKEFPLSNVNAADWLDLVAVGTIADLAPLDGENRTLARRGLRLIRLGRSPGLLALANISGINIHTLKAEDIGFRIGPRLNAAGRLGSAESAFQILMAKNTSEAGPLALKLDQENQKRQRITKEIITQIGSMYDPKDNEWMLFFWDKIFNEGVVGLAASKLVEQYYRPTIIGTQKGNLVRASCRSIPEINITNALDECNDLLEQHGGHAMAAGLTIKKENIASFKDKFNSICRRELHDVPKIVKINAEAQVKLKDLHPGLIKCFDNLEPVGEGNPKPLFIARDIKPKHVRKIGKSGDHLKMTVTDGDINFYAVAFRFGNLYEKIVASEKIDILFSYDLNVYNSRKSLQLNIKDIKINSKKNPLTQNKLITKFGKTNFK